jgi:ribonuclease HI
MKSTPLSSLQVECCESPLKFRRERLMLKYCIKIEAMHIHSAKSALAISKNPEHNIPNEPNIANIFSDFMKACPEKVEKQSLIQRPAWLAADLPLKVDVSLLSLLKDLNSKEKPENWHVENYLNENYSHYTYIFTDGSVNEKCHSGIGIYIPSINLNLSRRLPDNLLVKSVELAAINEAIDIIETNRINNALILCDCLMAINDLRTNCLHHLSKQIEQKLNILLKKNFSISFCWIPGHKKIHGNEMADHLAKTAVNQAKCDLEIKMSFDEKFQQIDKFIEGKWELFWNLSTTGLKYRSIFVKLLKKPLRQILPRSKETLITRLRLQHCLLNN